ncbi:Carboxylesterase [Actinobacteria bacterium OK074]|nr:Carboxylesterase [Actinobacteria bacterium OK074]
MPSKPSKPSQTEAHQEPEAAAAPTTGAPPEARTATGPVRGRYENGLAVFRGIPFAEPPVGEARFAAPRPLRRGWDGVREAYDFGPPPPQESGFAGRTGQLTVPLGDDWLTVNVWTPAPDPAAHRPVMVWLYGGAYKLGHAGSPGYEASNIARDGDVVVVTVNYRVGIEGFAQLADAPANRGLLDQVAALEWVRENAAAFGGDPDRVTVFGESAGAGSVAALLAMPSARGLFRRAITQSVPGLFFSRELAADIAGAIAAEAGLRPTVADLSTVDPRELPTAGEALIPKTRQYEDRWGLAAHGDTLFAPVVDGEVLPTTPWQALAAGAAGEVDLIAGHNREEVRLFLALTGKLGKVTEAQARETLTRLTPTGVPDAEQAYRTAYPNVSLPDLSERAQSDWLFNMPSLRLAEAHASAGGRAYAYELTWPAPAYGGALGACHGLDIGLLFGTFAADLGNFLFEPEVSQETRDLSAAFRTAWTRFAHTGDPGWPRYTPATGRLTQLWDTPTSVAPYPEEPSRALWEQHEFPALPLLGA